MNDNIDWTSPVYQKGYPSFDAVNRKEEDFDTKYLMKKLWSKIKSFFETKRDPGDLSRHRLYSDRYEDMRM